MLHCFSKRSKSAQYGELGLKIEAFDCTEESINRHTAPFHSNIHLLCQ